VRIALVTQHYPPHFEGGTEAVVRAQARELAALGHQVLVVSGTDRPHEGDDVLRETVDGLPVAFLPRVPDEPYDLTLVRPRLAALVRREVARAELVHVHHWSTLSSAVVRLAGGRPGEARRPLVTTLHDLFTTCPRFFRVPVAPVEACPPPGDLGPCVRCVAVDAPGVPVQALAQGLAARRVGFAGELAAAAAVVVPSASHRDRLAPFFDPALPWRVVPHGLGRALPRVADLPSWRGAGPLRVLYLGHRVEVKGVRDLVQALCALPGAMRRRVELHLLGAEVQPGFDAELAAEAGDLALRFHSAYEPEELPERVATIGPHLAALPSRVAESYGLVVDEALALGLPTWVADRGAPRERVGEAGLVLPAEDPAAWTAAFGRIFDRPDRLEVQRARVPRQIRTAADAARELEALYEALLLRPA